jgi:hypothetical protein
MYTKEHSSYLRILEKGEEFEEYIRVSAVDVTVECAVDVVVGAIQPATNTAPSTKFAVSAAIIYAWPLLLTDAYSCE